MSHIKTLIVSVALLAMLVWCAPSDLEDTELILVHVILRHGARTTYNFYPNDPHKNLTFYPTGLGGLTNEGKYGEYKLGKWLRREYNELLGDTYAESLIQVRSTDTARTKMSAQLVLAGLWPPRKDQVWHPELTWQPIPVHYKKITEENLLSPSYCDYRTHILKNMPSRPEVQESYIKPYQRIFDYVGQHSGSDVKTLIDLLDFYFIIVTEDEIGLPLPKWTERIYPEPLISAASRVYSYWNHDEEVRKINSGYLLKKLIDDSVAKMNGTLNPAEIKMFMYSGHESTLGCLLSLLDVITFKTRVPPYGSAVILELRKNGDGKYFFQLKYHKNTKLKPKVLTIPGCEALCPVDKFQDLQKKNLPTVSFQEACSLSNKY